MPGGSVNNRALRIPESKVPPPLYFGRSEAAFVITQKGAERLLRIVHAQRHFRSERVRLHLISLPEKRPNVTRPRCAGLLRGTTLRSAWECAFGS